MSSINVAKKEKEYTHMGARAWEHLTPKQKLERTVMSCLLWENEHYEEGVSITERLSQLVEENETEDVIDIIDRAKFEMRLRHVPLFLVSELAKKANVRAIVRDIITRPDDMCELLAIYWRDGKKPLSNSIKRGIADAFHKFDEYQLAKYNGGKKAIKLRDVARIVHPSPVDITQEVLWGKLINGSLETPDTWEVALSATDDKRGEWNRLIQEKRLGGLAMLRNIRNMKEASVLRSLIKEGIDNIDAGRLLPINFIAAAKYNPEYEAEIEQKFFQCFTDKPKLKGRTILVIDTSGSMQSDLSNKGNMTRLDVAGALAAVGREMCEDVAVYCTAGNDSYRTHKTKVIPNRRGMSLSSYINNRDIFSEIGYGGIFLKQCMDYIYDKEKTADRIIILTDEQDCDYEKSPESANAFGDRNYLINVASNKNGVGYGKWHHIDGWSDRVLDYIVKYEELNE